jgi:RNA polymerase sigma-70 factor (ECF subfamily)
MQSLSDEHLLDIYKTNKDGQGHDALTCLYNRYAKQLLNFFYFTLHNDYNKAQDLVHDLFLKLIEKHNTFDNSQIFKAWIFRVASNMCNNEFRSDKVVQRYKNHVISTTGPEIINTETAKILRLCIANLSREQRSLIVLRFKLKLSIREMAGIYECAEGTIKSRLFYATKELSKLYKILDHESK